jgi:hypothetical protein
LALYWLVELSVKSTPGYSSDLVTGFSIFDIPEDVDKDKFYKALDVLESPWSRRDESLLRQWFDSQLEGSVKSKYLVDNILGSGLEPAQPVEPLPPIQLEDIELLVWMAVKPL